MYCFYKNGSPFSAIIGSANLGAIKLEAANRRQYELSALITDKKMLTDIDRHIERLNAPLCSANIADISGMPLIREVNTALNGIDLVTTKSNINVCYAAPRSKRKARDWFETQLTVGADVYKMDGYPEKNKPFFVVTDDGYWFKAHTTSDNNKQFSAVGDELIMGRWLKGRLAAAGIVKPVNNTAEDTERLGMITQEMLDEYGCDSLYFKKDKQP